MTLLNIVMTACEKETKTSVYMHRSSVFLHHCSTYLRTFPVLFIAHISYHIVMAIKLGFKAKVYHKTVYTSFTPSSCEVCESY